LRVAGAIKKTKTDRRGAETTNPSWRFKASLVHFTVKGQGLLLKINLKKRRTAQVKITSSDRVVRKKKKKTRWFNVFGGVVKGIPGVYVAEGNRFAGGKHISTKEAVIA